MSRIIYFDELETVWHRTTYEVDDTWTDERIQEFAEGHFAYELEEEEGINYVESEYLYDTGELQGSIEIEDEEYKMIYKKDV